MLSSLSLSMEKLNVSAASLRAPSLDDDNLAAQSSNLRVLEDVWRAHRSNDSGQASRRPSFGSGEQSYAAEKEFERLESERFNESLEGRALRGGLRR